MKYSINQLIRFLLPVLVLASACSNKKQTLFELISSGHSGITFNNRIIENDTLNPLDVTNIYNGGGVGIGDFNNDGLQDIYFTGNVVPNKLYLNKGNFKFEDITKDAGVDGAGKWCRGVALVDINNDGWMDMYVCASMLKDGHMRENLLYVNQGVDAGSVPKFKEMAGEYGLNDSTHSTMAAFFDYDNDGDLDMYLVVNEIRQNDNPSVFRPVIRDGSHFSTGRLYQNNWNDGLKHPVYTNVTKQAGVTIEGYGHGVSIADFNQDGWKDIFVTNDFVSNDLLYINNHDGTFTDKSAQYFKHTSANGMGQDVIDINNDGLSDVVELDMNPEDNYRKKTMMMPNNYRTYQNTELYGYQYQYVRNTLQVNQGPRVNQMDSIGDPVFSDIGFLSGISETDWSWTPLVQDFDNDGWRDIIVTNGFPKDITDRDFMAFSRQSFQIASKEYRLSQIPQVKIKNYAFRNKGDLSFSNNTADWGITLSSFSNGAAYADLDNDGDLDFVVNNINDEAFVYRNNESGNKNKAHYLTVKLAGDSLNKNG
ncbi:MAG TPA: VCBS repeat-containing protein, partial [Chitinophagaceae bacterium]|nr:VCBS repeat-containing protein [Chitinophagaceae bacterium]